MTTLTRFCIQQQALLEKLHYQISPQLSLEVEVQSFTQQLLCNNPQ